MNRLIIRASDDEVRYVQHAASLRNITMAEYVRRAVNASLRSDGVDAVLFAEDGREPRRSGAVRKRRRSR